MTDRPIIRYRNKTYIRIPGGEIQWGHISHSLTIWWRGKRRWPR